MCSSDLGCRNIVKVRHFLEFPEKRFDFVMMSHKYFRSLFELGCGKSAFEQVSTEGVDPAVEAMSEKRRSR